MKSGGWADGRTGGRRITLALLLSTYPTIRLSAQCPDGSPPPCRAAPAARAPAPSPPPNSVAVLYFDNLSRDTADAYLADGLTDELIARVGQLERLRVKSRTAVRRYRGSTADPVALGRALHVAHLVNGSVRRSGTRLRVTVELLRAPSGDRVWGTTFDRTDTDLLDLQEQIATAVAAVIAGRLLPAERASLARVPTRNRDAYDHYLRGNYDLAQRQARATERAIKQYEAAIRLDPQFTAALARVAYCYGLALDWDWALEGAPPESLLARGFATADRAFRQDSTVSDTWMARGYLLVHRHPRTLEGAREAFERAIALAPTNAEAWHQYGWVLQMQRDEAGALAAFHRALAIEPERAITVGHVAALHWYAGRPVEALRWFDSTLALEPWFPVMLSMRALVRLQLADSLGALADARAALRGAEEPLYGETALATIQAHLGDTVAARALADRLAASALGVDPVPGHPGVYVAAALVALGDHDRALDLVERIRPRSAHFATDLQLPQLDPIRADPRFQRVLEESRPR